MENKRKRIPLPVGVYIIFGLLVLRAFGQNIWYGSKPILQYTIVYNDLQYLRDWYYMDDIEKALVLLVSAFIIDNYIGKFILTLISEIALAISCILVTISCINILNWSRIKILYAHEEVLNIFEGIRYKIFEIIFFNQFIFPYHYFTWEKFLYFTNFLGNIMYMIFMYVSPLITEGVHCFGKNRCLSLTFSLTNIFDIISILIFIIEMHRIRKRKVERNIVVNMFKCIVTGIRGKIKFRKEKRHWLDYAVEKHGKALVERVKMVCGIFLITFSLLIFEIISSIFMNSFSMQINKMNRRFLGYNINVSNIFYFKVFVQVLVFPIIIILLPILRKHQIIYTPLQRIGAALILSMLSYFCATALSIHIDLNDDPLPTVGICQFRIYNNYNQDLDFMKTEFQDFTWHVNSMDIFSINVPVRRSRRINYTYEKNNIQKTVQFEFEEQKAIGYYFSESGELERFEDDVSKIHETYSAKVRVLANSGNIIYEIQDLQNESFYYGFSFNNSAQIVFPGTYNLSLDEQHAGTFEFLNGGIYAFLIYVENLSNIVKLIEVSKPYQVHLFWTLPQYILVSISDLLYTINLEIFCCIQSPVSLTVFVFCTVKAISKMSKVLADSFTYKNIENITVNNIIYSILMGLYVILFLFLSSRYVYESDDDLFEEEENETLNSDTLRLENLDSIEGVVSPEQLYFN